MSDGSELICYRNPLRFVSVLVVTSSPSTTPSFRRRRSNSTAFFTLNQSDRSLNLHPLSFFLSDHRKIFVTCRRYSYLSPPTQLFSFSLPPSLSILPSWMKFPRRSNPAHPTPSMPFLLPRRRSSAGAILW